MDVIKKTYVEHPDISVTSKWRDVQDHLRDNETFRWSSCPNARTSQPRHEHSFSECSETSFLFVPKSLVFPKLVPRAGTPNSTGLLIADKSQYLAKF